MPLSAGWRRIWFLQCVALLATGLFAGTPPWLMPPWRSADGRLETLELDDSLLALITARLVLPWHRSWKEIRLRYQLADGEALSVAADRTGDDFDVARVSRTPLLSSGRIRIRDGALFDTSPAVLSASAAQDGEMVLRRTASGVDVSVEGAPGFATLRSEPSGALDLAMFPPWSTQLFSRVKLERVELDDGSELATRPPPSWTLLSSGPSLVVIALLVGWALVSGTPSPLARVLPHHTSHHPGHVSVLLAAVTAGVVGVALALGVSDRHPPVGAIRQARLRVAMLGVVAWPVLVTMARDRLLARFPDLGSRKLMHGALLVPQIVLVTAAILGLVAGVLGRRGADLALPARLALPGAELRVLCYGGSRLSGAPIVVEDLPPDFPRLLEGILYERDPAAVVWDRGPSVVTGLARRVEFDTRGLAPSHVVFYTKLSDYGLKPGSFSSRLELISQLASRGAQPLFAEEMEFDSVYGSGSPAYLPAYRELVAAHRFPYVELRPLFEENREHFLFLDRDQHLTRYGHRLVARALADAIAPPAQ